MTQPLVALFLGLLRASSPAEGAAPPLTQVQIVDPEGKALAQAQVTLLRPKGASDALTKILPPLFEAQSDERGALGMPVPTLDGLLLLVDHPAYLPLVLPDPISADLGQLRVKPGRRWSSQVQFADAALEPGRICARWDETFAEWNAQRRWERCAILDPKGDFTLQGLPGEEIQIEVEAGAPGFLSVRQSVRAGIKTQLRLERGVLLRGRVMGSGIEPVAAASLKSKDGGQAAAGLDGSFTIAVRSLPVAVEVQAPGYRRESFSIAKASDAAVLRMRPGEQVLGMLLDDQSLPVVDALVHIERHLDDGSRQSRSHRVKSADGAFRIDLAQPGAYRLRIRAADYREQRLPEISVAAGQSYDLGVIGLARGAGVTGTLVDAQSGKPLPGAEVTVLPQGSELVDAILQRAVARGVSDQAGAFAVYGLASGRFEVRGEHSGYATAVRRVALQNDLTEELGEVRMSRGVVLRGRVVARDGQPRADATVKFLDPEQETLLPIAQRRSDTQGRFVGPALAPGLYRVQVHGQRLLLAQELEVAEDEEEMEVELIVQSVHLRGWITRGGEAVTGGQVVLSSALDPNYRRGKLTVSSPGHQSITLGLPESSLTAAVGPEGSFELQDAPAGAVWLTFTDGSSTATRLVSVPDQARAEITVDVEGTDLLGRLVDLEQGAGIAGSIRVVDPLSGRVVADTDSNGEGFFVARRVQPGRYSVEASAPGFATASRPDVEVGGSGEPLVIQLRRGSGGNLHVRLRRTDGSPIAGSFATVLDGSGIMVRSALTDAYGERQFEDLTPGSYFVVWSDALVGTGVSRRVEVSGEDPTQLDETVAPGGSVELACGAGSCAGAGLDFLALYSPTGIEIGGYLSGMASALRFSPEGRLSIGRLSPGTYLLRVWAAGQRWDKSLAVDSGTEVVALP